MSTPMYYNFTGSSASGEPANNKRPLRSQQDMNQIDKHRQAAISPAASFATSSSNSSSSLNSQFNSLTPSSSATSTSTTSYSSSSSSSSDSSSTASSTNLVKPTPNAMAPPPSVGPRSISSFNRDLLRQTSMTPTQNYHSHHHRRQHHSPSQLTHSYTLHSLEPKPLKPFKSRSAYIDAMKEDLAEWLNSIYSDLELTPEGFFSQLETGAIICRHANNVTQMGRNMMVDEQTTAAANNLDSAASSNSDNENNSSINDSSITSQQNSLSSPLPDQDQDNHHQHPHQHLQLGHPTSLNFSSSHQAPAAPSTPFTHRHRHSTTNSSISSISTTTTTSSFTTAGRPHRLSLTGSACASSRSSDKNIDWFRVKVIPYKADARAGTFFARDNICQFILWCRSLNILECLLFETDDLVGRKNEKSFILCMLEVARIGFKVGMPTPLIIQLEQEIDREIENDAKLQRQLEDDALGAQVKLPDGDDNLQGAERVAGNEVSNDNNNNNTEDGDGRNGLASAMQQQLELGDDDCGRPVQAELRNEKADTAPATANNETAEKNVEVEREEEEEYCSEDFGPKPQVITNDLLSLHERVVQLLCQCTCATQFPMVRIGDGKYKVGDKLIIFVRILRRHIMVRVGGGWQELSEFLRQKDPCRTTAKHAVGIGGSGAQSYSTPQHSTGGNRPLGNTSTSPSGPTSLMVGASSIVAAVPQTPPTPGSTNFCSIPVYRSRLTGSSNHLNSRGHKTHKALNGSTGSGASGGSSGGQRLISNSASMSWLSHS